MKLNPYPNKRLLVCDDFYEDPDEVRRFALAQEFRHNPTDHKGQRTVHRFCFPGVREKIEALLGERVTAWDGHGYNGVFQFCVGGDQIVYHSDVQKWAGVVFLTPDAPPQSGTTLYRSRRTKGRTVDESVEIMRRNRGFYPKPADAEREMYHGKLLDPTAWEAVDVVGNVYNRLVVWDARLVHAASCYFGDSKDNGRLFQMFFFG